MSDLKDDKDLERRFEQLRSGDRVSLRSLEALLASRSWRIPRRPRSLRLAVALLVILVLVVVTIIVETRSALERPMVWPVRVDAPPDLLLRNDAKLGLTPEQRSAIRQEVQQLQIKIVPLESRRSDEEARLGNMLGRDRVAESEALTQLDRVLAVEREIKRAQLAVLVRVENVLTPEQQKMLKSLR